MTCSGRPEEPGQNPKPPAVFVNLTKDGQTFGFNENLMGIFVRLVYAISTSNYNRRLSHLLPHKPAKDSNVFLGFCIISSQKIIKNTMNKHALFRFLHPPGVKTLTTIIQRPPKYIVIPLVNTVPLRTFWNWKVRVHINFTLRGAGCEILRTLQKLVGSLMNFIKLL